MSDILRAMQSPRECREQTQGSCNLNSAETNSSIKGNAFLFPHIIKESNDQGRESPVWTVPMWLSWMSHLPWKQNLPKSRPEVKRGWEGGMRGGYYGRLKLIDGALINTMANLGELSWWALRESWLGSRLPQTLVSAFYKTKWLNVLVSSPSHLHVFIFLSSLHTSHLWAHTSLVSAAPFTANYPKVLHEVTTAATAPTATAEYHATATMDAPQEHSPTSLILLWRATGWLTLPWCGRDYIEFSTGWNNPAPPLQDLFWRLQKETLSQKPTTKTNLKEPFCVLS